MTWSCSFHGKLPLSFLDALSVMMEWKTVADVYLAQPEPGGPCVLQGRYDGDSPLTLRHFIETTARQYKVQMTWDDA